jgi:acetoin utilization deacetylase AcuC-like enzyme
LRLVHSAALIERERRAAAAAAWHNPDTYTTNGTWQAALHAAGGAIKAVEMVASGQATNAFALVRPPGHHATPSHSMGFCMFNNIAVAAQYARTKFGVQRLAIVDYDVHHGNGTQDTFYADEHVLFCSTHGSPLYPGTGMMPEIGQDAGRGTTLNVPLPFNTGDHGFQQVYAEVLLPVVRRFQPDMILVSAGFDAHWADPIGPLALSVAGYAALTERLVALAKELCDGKIVLVLEGGYNLDALGACTVAALRALLGRAAEADPLGPAPMREPDITTLIRRLKTAWSLEHRV